LPYGYRCCIVRGNGVREMKNNRRRKASRKARPGKGLHTVRVPVKKSPKTTLDDIHRAIKKKLATEPTDIVQSADMLILVVERF